MKWREELATLPSFAPAHVALERDRTALIMVDMQYLDAHPNEGLGKYLEESYPDVWRYYFGRLNELALPNMRRLLDAFRTQEMRVLHLTIGSELEDGSDMIPLRRPEVAPGLSAVAYCKGSHEHQILSELAPLQDELTINKRSRGAFNSTAIERIVRTLGIETLIVVGVATSTCVDLTARDAADRGFYVVIVEDATADLHELSHEATLLQFAMRWGQVWSTDETLSRIAEARLSGVKKRRGSPRQSAATP